MDDSKSTTIAGSERELINDDGTRTSSDGIFSISWLSKPRKNDCSADTIGPLGLRPLHLSAEPLVDLIFVHGLRGGSVKTWRKGQDPKVYWPQNWLPFEPGFQNVNIHTFGYNANVGNSKNSILNALDFGTALLGEMKTSPHIRKRKKDPIILIGHSMGGLLIKVAYNLALQDSRDPELGQRLRSFFFLATPHRGSDFAAFLSSMLRISGVRSTRKSIGDLERNSKSAQSIDDDFRAYLTDNISLWSFFETVATSIFTAPKFVVDKESAILGYGNENIHYLYGGHRDICKYENPEDSNYIILRDALAKAISDLLSGGMSEIVSKEEESRAEYRAELKSIRAYLDISDRPEEDFANQKDIKSSGSCRWLEERKEFQAWRDLVGDTLAEKHHTPQFYWLSARPGSGKTVLAAHIVAHLQDRPLDCAYYFFHHGNKSGQSLSGLLRSLAYQMACSNTTARGLIQKLNNEGLILDKDDERLIWRKFFLGGILQIKICRPQYWVIDALDECVKYAEFFTLISKVETAFPLQILVTSRMMPEIESQFLQLGKNVTRTEISLQDSIRDIEAYIQNKIEVLPLDSDHKKQDLANAILAKSSGSFLWVRLVLEELSNVYSDNGIWAVLDEIPEGMVPFYQRAIETMSRNRREIEITKAILLWTIFSIRPLKTAELQKALELDIGAKVRNIKKTVEGLCGQLIFVDKNDTVQIVHTTAREYLVGESTSEFAIPKQKGHERIALSCLRCLSSNEMKPPRNRRSLNTFRREVSAFRDYACTAFSEHVFSAFSEADTILLALDLFLRTNVLSWIEHVSRKGTLYYISRTAKNLRGYLGRRAKYLSPLGSQVERVDAWTTDLSRLTAKFGVTLLTDASAIYFVIPPFCPTQSAIFKQFGSSPDGLVLNGVRRTVWEDCISWTDFNNSATSIASGDKAFAVGMETGAIEIYNRASCQWERTLQHHEPIDVLRFEISGQLLVSCGSRSIKLWDISGSELWTQRLTSRCIELAFQTKHVVGVSMNGQVTIWTLQTGEISEAPQRYLYKEPDDGTGTSQARGPGTASISPDFEIIALGTRKSYVCLWSLQDSELIGWCSTLDADVVALVLFNPNPNISILAVGYTTGRLAIFDPWSQEMIHSVKAGNGHQQISSLVSSPDGRTLATVDSSGTMQVWDFETLTLVYHVKSSDNGFRTLDFSSNGLRILDLMESKLRVWEPAVLVRKTVEEDFSVSDAAVLPAIQGRDETKVGQKITAMTCHPTLPFILVGKYDGSLTLYESKTGKEEARLYTHSSGVFVKAIAVSLHDIVASGDVNGVVQIWQLTRSADRSLQTGSLVLKTSAGAAIQQLLISPAGDFTLISTAKSTSVFSIRTGICTGQLDKPLTDKSTWKWVVRTDNQLELLLLAGEKLLRYGWDNFPNLSSPQTLTLPAESLQLVKETTIKCAVIDACSQNLIIDFHQNRGHIATEALLILSIGNILFSPEMEPPPTTSIELVSNPAYIVLRDRVKYFLGISGPRLLFIDSESWLSSVDLTSSNPNGAHHECTRHFFVPNEFVARDAHVLPLISPGNGVVFAVESELVVVCNGLKFQNFMRRGELGRK